MKMLYGFLVSRIRQLKLDPFAVAVFTGVLSYRGGLWLNALHIGVGVEANEPPLLIHWLRDSTLMLPVVFLSVLASLVLARWLLERLGLNRSSALGRAIVILTIALITSAAEGAASPIHDALFQAREIQGHGHGAGQPVDVFAHMLYDGQLAFFANVLISGVLFALWHGKLWTARRPGQSIPSQSVQAEEVSVGRIPVLYPSNSIQESVHIKITP
jgi:hypothetical protein